MNSQMLHTAFSLYVKHSEHSDGENILGHNEQILGNRRFTMSYFEQR